jgi:hypothetical protein
MRRQARLLVALALPSMLALALLAAGPPAPDAAAAAQRPAGAQTTTGSRRHAPAPVAVALPVTPSGPSAPVVMAPVGLSLEYPLMAEYLGEGPCPPPALVAELRRLGSPPLALAGISQDLTVPPGALSGPPGSWETATLFPLPATFWSQLHCLLGETGDLLDAGLNMRKGEPAWAAQMAAGAASAATNGLEFSLGNEPDLYALHNYPTLAAAPPHPEAEAVGLYLQIATALQQAIGNQPVIGPELARAIRWRRQLPRVIAQLHDHVLGVHLYPLSACEGPGGVTIPKLLAPSSADAPRELSWVVADANTAHIPAILSESNSASCGGQAGVSDSPAAAVWAVRFVVSALETGFREVRFHFAGGDYDPFVLRGEQLIDRPLESALVALDQWLPVGSSLTTLRRAHGLVITAVAGSPHGPQLLVDNESDVRQSVVLRGISGVQVQLLSPIRAGLQSATLSSARGSVKLGVAPNTVLAVVTPSS